MDLKDRVREAMLPLQMRDLYYEFNEEEVRGTTIIEYTRYVFPHVDRTDECMVLNDPNGEISDCVQKILGVGGEFVFEIQPDGEMVSLNIIYEEGRMSSETVHNSKVEGTIERMIYADAEALDDGYWPVSMMEDE